MQTFLDIATLLLPLAYLLVAIDYGFLFFASQPFAERTATPALRGTVLLHLAYLMAATVQWRQFPAATVSQALSVVAFAVAVVYVFVEWHGRARSTGFWLVSLVFFFQLLSSLLTRPNPPDRAIFHDPSSPPTSRSPCSATPPSWSARPTPSSSSSSTATSRPGASPPSTASCRRWRCWSG